MRRPVSTHRIWLASALAVVALVGGAAPAAAAGDLRIEAHTAYELRPSDSTLSISIDYTITNRKASTQTDDVITDYFYDRLTVTVPAESVTATAVTPGGGNLFVQDAAAASETARVVTVLFGRQIWFGESASFTLTLDIPGGEPRSGSTIRANPAYAAFVARAWGDPDLSSVSISVPPGFEADFSGDDLVAESPLGPWSQSEIPNPDEWRVLFTARRDAALATTELEAAGLDIRVKSWPGDETWASRVAGVVDRALPELDALLGLDLQGQTTLTIVESIDPALLGYAGWYLGGSNVIELGEDLDDLVTVHELSHLWLDYELFASRWINEGLANEISGIVVETIGGEYDATRLEVGIPDPASAAAVPLNEWRLPESGITGDPAVFASEDYGYDTSLFVIQELRDEIGTEALIAVLRTADRDEIAYRGGGDPEIVSGPDDWRRFLDLLAEVGGSVEAETLFRDYVVTPDQLSLLDTRRDARETYQAFVGMADPLSIPVVIRAPMSSWEFDRAVDAIDAATAVLEANQSLGEAASVIGLEAPAPALARYETAGTIDDLLEAADRVAAQFESLDAVTRAFDALDGDRGLVASIGLLGHDVHRDWRSAASAFEVGDDAGAIARSERLITDLDGADRVGRLRVIWGGGVLLLLMAGAGTWVVVRHRRNAAADPRA